MASALCACMAHWMPDILDVQDMNEQASTVLHTTDSTLHAQNPTAVEQAAAGSKQTVKGPASTSCRSRSVSVHVVGEPVPARHKLPCLLA